jgi:hypothetical protein
MNQYLEPEVQRNKFVPWVLFLCLSFFIISAGFLSLKIYFSVLENSKQIDTANEKPPISMGRLYYSATLPGESVSSMFKVDLDTKTIEPINNSEGMYQVSDVLNNREAISYIDSEKKSFINVSEYSQSGDLKTSVVTLPKGDEIGTFSWNESTSYLAYNTKRELGTGTPLYEISIYDVASDTSRKVAEGFSPQFISEKNLLFLKSDGVYLLNIGTLEQTKLYAHDGYTATANSSIVIAPNNDYFIVAHANVASADVHKISKITDTIKIISSENVPGLMVSPIFSPDSRYLAFFQPHITNDVRKVTIETIDLESRKQEKQVELSIDLSRGAIMSLWK